MAVKTGDRFGRLVVEKEIECVISDSGQKYKQWLCKCDCGNIKETRESYLVYGYVKSCGCLNYESRNTGKKRKGNDYIQEEDKVIVTLSNCEEVMFCDIDIWNKAYNHTWSKNDHGYACARISGKIVLFHRFFFATDKDKIIDHIDRNKLNKLNNLKTNIRETDRRTNNININIRSNNKSGVSGVWYDKRRKLYTVYINVEVKKRKYIGGFKTLEEARIAREEAEKIYYK